MKLLKNLILFLTLTLILITTISAGSMSGETLQDLEDFRTKIASGEFDEKTFEILDKIPTINTAQQFLGIESTKLVEVWNNAESKKPDGGIDWEKTNERRKKIITGISSEDNKERDKFLSKLIEKNSNIPNLKFKFTHGRYIEPQEDMLVLVGEDGIAHKIPIKNLPKNIQEINFGKVSNVEGYAITYLPKGDKKIKSF